MTENAEVNLRIFFEMELLYPYGVPPDDGV